MLVLGQRGFCVCRAALQRANALHHLRAKLAGVHVVAFAVNQRYVQLHGKVAQHRFDRAYRNAVVFNFNSAAFQFAQHVTGKFQL